MAPARRPTTAVGLAPRPRRGAAGLEPQRQGGPDQELGEPGGRAEVEPERRSAAATRSVERHGRDQAADRQPAGLRRRGTARRARRAARAGRSTTRRPATRSARTGCSAGSQRPPLLAGRPERRRPGPARAGPAPATSTRVERGPRASRRTARPRPRPGRAAPGRAGPPGAGRTATRRRRRGRGHRGAPQHRGDDEAAEHEEDVDADGAAVEERGVPGQPVQREDGADRDRADAVEVVEPSRVRRPHCHPLYPRLNDSQSRGLGPV